MLVRVEFDALRRRLDAMHEAIASGRVPAEVSFQAMEGVLEAGLRVIDPRLGSIHPDVIIRPEPGGQTDIARRHRGDQRQDGCAAPNGIRYTKVRPCELPAMQMNVFSSKSAWSSSHAF